MRLLDEKPSISTLQGLLVLNTEYHSMFPVSCSAGLIPRISFNLRGRDVEGWNIMGKMVKMHDDLNLHDEVGSPLFGNTLSENIDSSRQLAAWATFNLHV